MMLLLIGGGNAVWADTSTLIFTSKCNGSGTADDGVKWTVTSDGNESDYDRERGIHYGTNKAAVGNITLTTSGISGTVTKVVVNASTASGVTATASVTVGGTAFGGAAQSLSSTETDYTFTGSASGEIVVTVAKPSKAVKALYVMSVKVTYEKASASPLSSIALSGDYPTTFREGDAFSHAGMTVTATYEDETTKDVTSKAVFTGYDMETSGEQTVTVTYTEGGNTKYTTYDITVNEKPSHNVTFSVNGATTSTSYKEGAAIDFPDDPADINGMTFVGWYGSTYSNASVAPEFVTSATMGTSDVTYYAVFADVSEGDATTITDNLIRTTTGVAAGGGYSSWSGKKGTSGAVYAGQSAGGNGAIQLRSNNSNSGVITTTSGGKATKVAVVWDTNTAEGRTINIYGKNTAYSSATDLYNTSDQGSLLGTLVYGTSTDLTINGDYEYIGVCSADGALYLNTFSITWESGTAASYTNYCTTVSALPKPVITLSTESIEMTWGDADKKLTATAKLGDADFDGTITLTPSSSNLTIAADGTITCNVPGNYTVTASIAAKDDEYQAANDVVCNVTVNKKAATITLNETTAELDIADDTPTTTLVATVSSGGNVIDDVTVTWSSDDPEVATVDEDGVVTAVAKGTATISASFTSDKYNISSDETCTVTVINSASGIIDLTKTGTVTISEFPSFSGSGYKTVDPYTINGVEWKVVDGMKSNDALQLKASTGVLTSPTIKSKKGFVVSVVMNTNTVTISDGTNSSTEGTLTVKDATATITFATGSSYAVISSITITPIKDDRTLAFSEPTTEVLVGGTVTNAATATPAGTISYSSSDETVATVDADGKVTGVKIGTATITATVDEDADYNVASDHYDITVNGIPAATNISLSATDTGGPVSLSELKVGDAGHFSASYVKATGEFTATVAYTSSNTDVLTIGENGAFTPAKGGTSTVTVTITPDDTDHYIEVSKDFVVTVLNVQKGTTALTIQNNDEEEQSSGSTLFGNNISLKAALATDYDGTVTATQTNSAIATVSITGENITITPKAVGTTTITFTAPETANFDGEVCKTYNLTVTAPEAKTESGYIPAVVVLNETFSQCDSNGGNGGDGFAPSSNTSISSADDVTDVEDWTLTNAYEANECLKLGSSKTAGSATTPTLSVSAGTTYVLTFNAAPWSEESATMTVNVTGGTIKGNASATTAIMTQKEWNAYEYEILATAAEMTITFSCSANRFFLDEVKVEKPEVAPAIPDAKIPSSGYGTFCCEYPLDFTEENSEYKAYAVTDVDGTNVTFTRITGKISGGVPFILYGTPGTYHLKVADESTVTPAGNLLVGTLAPTYVETVNGSYTNFGMSGGKFKKINTGVMPANKAYLPIANTLLSGSGAREFTFIFNDGATTGVSEVTSHTAQQPDAIYDLQGRKVETPKRGLYIINGKKVMIK